LFLIYASVMLFEIMELQTWFLEETRFVGIHSTKYSADNFNKKIHQGGIERKPGHWTIDVKNTR